MADSSLAAVSSRSTAEPIEQLLEQFRQRRRRALARLVTFLDDGAHLEQILAGLGDERRSLKVGVTGSAGAGKSTLVGALVSHLRSTGKSVAVLACDPESPFTGGALLGDRVRMDYEPTDDGVFVRSLSLRGGGGGLSDNVRPILRLVEQFGFDVVLIETVGVGQDEVAVQQLVDVLALVLTPAGGDDIQFEKAGLMEIADVIAMNKSDLPGADQALASLRATLELSTAGPNIPIARVVATTKEGVAELWQEIETLHGAGISKRAWDVRHRLLASLHRRLSQAFDERFRDDPQARAIMEGYSKGEVSESEAIQRLLPLLLGSMPDR